jgi:hypothetical protein
MPKPKPARKPAGKLFTPPAPPQIGDKVIPNDSPLVFEIIKIAPDGELTLNAPGTVLHRFRVDPATVKFVDQQRQGVPKAALNALEALSSEVHESWKSAVEKIEELLEE